MADSSRRKMKRRYLIFYLSVYELPENRLLGYMVDISKGGIKLMSNQPLEAERPYTLKVKLPEHGEYGSAFTLDAHCLWCRPGPNPDIYDAGFKLLDCPEGVEEAIRRVIEELGFNEH